MPISQKTLEFLAENRIQDSKAWFLEHKPQYEQFVRAPMLELSGRLGPELLRLDPQLVTDPKRTIARIYRDTRFSRDKTIFREVMWCVFMRDKQAFNCPPGLVFEFSPDGFRYGCGWYQTPPKTMEAMRALALENAPSFQAALAFYEGQDEFRIEGERYKRGKFSARPERLRDWLDRKSVSLLHNSRDFDLLFSDALAGRLLEGFCSLLPVYRLMLEASENARLEEDRNRAFAVSE